MGLQETAAAVVFLSASCTGHTEISTWTSTKSKAPAGYIPAMEVHVANNSGMNAGQHMIFRCIIRTFHLS